MSANLECLLEFALVLDVEQGGRQPFNGEKEELMNSPILAPASLLILWSLLVLGWLAATRLPAMRKVGVDLTTIVGGRGVDLQGVIPDQVNWISHNYTHLMEQPTIFYATVGILALNGAGDGINLTLAWAYVVLRIVHSLVQALWNRVLARFLVFGASTACLVMLAINAALSSAW